MDVSGEFSVAQFYDDGHYEYLHRWISAGQAVYAAREYTRRITDDVARVIITDGGDNTVFEWKRGKGITFPPEFKSKE